MPRTMQAAAKVKARGKPSKNGHAKKSVRMVPDKPVVRAKPVAELIPQAHRRPDMIPHGKIRPSPTNPRKTFNAASLESLAQSIRKVGLQQRIVVRPVRANGTVDPKWDPAGPAWAGVDHYQVICGERRLKACKLAGLELVPVEVTVVPDDVVEAVQLVENDQREDLLVSEQVASYKRLADRGKTAEQICDQTGSPLSFVRGILSLARLPADVLAAVDRGRLPRTCAELLARIPGDEARTRASRYVMAGQRQVYRNEKAPEPRPDAEPLSWRDTKHLIAEYFQKQLKEAPFDRVALDLVPAAGSCEACPKRAGNVPEAVGDGVRADMCLDPDCYRKKLDAHNARQLAAAQESGHTLLSASKSAGLFSSWGEHALAYEAPYVELDRTCYEDRKSRTWRTLLKGKLTDDQVVVAVDPDGRPRLLVDKKFAAGVARKEHGIGKPGRSQTRDSARTAKEVDDRDRKAKLGKLAAAEANRLVAERVVKDFRGAQFLSPASVAALRQLAASAADFAWTDACRVVARRRKLEGAPKDALREFALSDCDSGELLGLVAELLAARMSEAWGGHWQDDKLAPEEVAFWKAFGVDKDALVAGVAAAADKPALALVRGGKGASTRTGEQDAEDIGLLPPRLAKLPDMPVSIAGALSQKGVRTIAELTARVEKRAEPKDLLPLLDKEITALTGGNDKVLVSYASEAVVNYLAANRWAMGTPAGADADGKAAAGKNGKAVTP